MPGSNLLARRTGRNWALLAGNAPLSLIPYQDRIMAPQAGRIWALESSDDIVGRSPLFPWPFLFFSVEETFPGNKKPNE